MLADDAPVAARARGIDVRERLVHHEHGGAGRERAGDREAGLLALAEFVRSRAGACGQIKGGEQRVEPLSIGARDGEMLACGAMRPEPAVLRHPRERRGPAHAAALRFLETGEHIEQRSFPRTGPPDHRGDAGAQRERHVAQPRRRERDVFENPERVGGHQRRAYQRAAGAVKSRTATGAANAARNIAESTAVWP